MWQKLLQYALTFILKEILSFLKDEWADYKDKKSNKEEIDKKVKTIRDAKTKKELKDAISNFYI